MPLTLITGPMKSGKSLELMARVAPHAYADKVILYVQADNNSRDEGVSSRLGLDAQAVRAKSLTELDSTFDVIGIDEINMFPQTDVVVVAKWLKDGKEVFICGLDLDYRGIMPPLIKSLYELQPEIIIRKLAVCDECKQLTAQFTQILDGGEPILEGLPLVTPEDGTYEYQARCRVCFKTLSRS